MICLFVYTDLGFVLVPLEIPLSEKWGKQFS